MIALIQRVSTARVAVDGETVGACGRGYLVLLGVAETDEESDIARLGDKLLKLRIFADENGKMNRSILDVGGEALVVSQFTLMANYSHGNRPEFFAAAHPEKAERFYEAFVAHLRRSLSHVGTGSFGAHMEVSLTNDGPVTIILDSNRLKKKD
ncbi:MAG: D-tyrosyl-tRNA(Tyr) deacylase [Ruminococcaceae bacterium]|nr:D-tyrosyl-tRNA(Tyr) deacylase [Oscillospiraceae bacterium]